MRKISINASYLCPNTEVWVWIQIWNPRFLTGHYGALDLQRQTSIEARNDKFLRKAMEEDDERQALEGFWKERDLCKWDTEIINVNGQQPSRPLPKIKCSRFLLKLPCFIYLFIYFLLLLFWKVIIIIIIIF